VHLIKQVDQVVVELVVILVNQVEQEIVHQLVHHKEIMEEMVIRQGRIWWRWRRWSFCCRK
jgi:hypothetical protein